MFIHHESVFASLRKLTFGNTQFCAKWTIRGLTAAVPDIILYPGTSPTDDQQRRETKTLIDRFNGLH